MKMLALIALIAAVSPLAWAANLDVAVLNFALNLEYLEANFYSCAAYGKPIDKSLWGPKGVEPIGCKKGHYSTTAWQVADEIARDEIAHVKFLREALGDAAVDQPKLDLGPAFVAAANAAASLAFNRSVTLKPSFDPYLNDVFFYHGAFIFEDVGATAYAGAAALLTDKGILTAAAQILTTEAYHAGAIRTLLAKIQNNKTPFGLLVRDVVQAISDLRDAVDGPSDIDQGIYALYKYIYHNKAYYKKVWNLFPTDDAGLSFTRTTDQVLRIVYLGGASKGGFYPNGLNGDIKAVSS